MEAAFPNAVALMTIGCGADVGPLPHHRGHEVRVLDEPAVDQVVAVAQEECGTEHKYGVVDVKGLAVDFP